MVEVDDEEQRREASTLWYTLFLEKLDVIVEVFSQGKQESFKQSYFPFLFDSLLKNLKEK